MILALLIFHILVTLVLIGVILLQKGEDMNESAKAGSSRGGQSLLTRITVIAAGFFFGDCILMAILVRLDAQIHSSEKKMLTPVEDKVAPPAASIQSK
jgi:protein translocase SecG subunit